MRPHTPTSHPALAPDVIARVLDGDPRASRALVERYERPVFALLSRMLAPASRHDRVEDLAQETFLRVFRALHRFDPNGRASLSTWIMTIATRLAIDELRRARPETVALSHTLQAPVRSPEQDAQRRKLAAAIEAAIAELSPEQRAVFVLTEFHGMAQRDISEALQCDVGTVKSRLSRGRARLRAALKEVRHG